MPAARERPARLLRSRPSPWVALCQKASTARLDLASIWRPAAVQGGAGAHSRLFHRRVRRRLEDLGCQAADERPVLFGLGEFCQALLVGDEGAPLLLAFREALPAQHVDQLLGRAAQLVGPEADDMDVVLLEVVHGDVGEAAADVGQASGHGVVGAELVEHDGDLLVGGIDGKAECRQGRNRCQLPICHGRPKALWYWGMADKSVSLPEIRTFAKKLLPRDVWNFGDGAAESETTKRRNRRAIDRLAIRQDILVDIRE